MKTGQRPEAGGRRSECGRRRAAWFCFCILHSAFCLSGLAQGTAFTYQGRLTDGTNAASGLYDFRFRIATDAAGNNLVGSPFLTNSIPVSNGLFTAAVDFGPGIFTGSNYWLEVDVRTNGAASYVTLNPLQPVTPSPYAIFAGAASNVVGIVSSANLSGTYSGAVSFNNSANSFNGSFSGNGSTISNVNAASVGGVVSSNLWQLTGNNVAAGQFLGSTNNQPFEIRVNGQRALRLEPNTSGAPNVIVGASVNVVSNGVVGATIGGGGSTNYSGAPALSVNSVSGNFGTVSGGQQNTAGEWGFVGGGDFNSAAFAATVGGGGFNNASGPDATIGGGQQNIASGFYSTTGGGANNLSSGQASTVAGGNGNQATGDYTTAAGGSGNVIDATSTYSFIGGGNLNRIQNASYAAIAGGNGNFNGGYISAIGGGENNLIQAAADHTVIAGGGSNTVVGSFSLPVYDTIGGGFANTLQTNVIYSVIGGGRQNLMTAGTAFSTISGGSGNTIFPGAANATICGGTNNVAGADSATVVGGFGNTAASPASVAMGGNSSATGFAAIAMGQGTVVNGNNSLAAGFFAHATNQNAFVWGDSSGFFSTNDNSFNVHAAGGVRLATAGAGMSLDGPFRVTGGAISGNGGALTNVNALTLAGSASSNYWQLGGNNVASSQFLGSTNNQPVELWVNGGRALRLEPGTSGMGAPNVIAGSSASFVLFGAVGATIGGGGATNYSGSSFANSVTGDFGTVAGGSLNTAGNNATVGGGFNNTASGAAATVGGGVQNNVSGPDATVGGGFNNTASGGFATVIGGNSNQATNNYATIIGGQNNAAGGQYSLAAGQHAKALHDGSFVWADSTAADFASSSPNQFLIRASGGVGIGKTNPATALDVNGTVAATGFSGSGAGLTGVAPASGSANYIQNQLVANQTAGFRITGNGIFNGGNVGIGTTGPATTLHVRATGDTEISIESVQGGERWTLQSSGTNTVGKAGSFQLIDRTVNASRVVIDTNGNFGVGRVPAANVFEVEGNASKTAAGSWLANSDARIKQDIEPVSGALDKLDRVRLVSFRYTDDYKRAHPSVENRRYLNVVAQEFREVFPEDVKSSGEKLPDGSDDILQVDTYPLTIYSAAAIQELNRKMEDGGRRSEDRIQKLEAENAELKGRLEKLERLMETKSSVAADVSQR